MEPVRSSTMRTVAASTRWPWPGARPPGGGRGRVRDETGESGAWSSSRARRIPSAQLRTAVRAVGQHCRTARPRPRAAGHREASIGVVAGRRSGPAAGTGWSDGRLFVSGGDARAGDELRRATTSYLGRMAAVVDGYLPRLRRARVVSNGSTMR